MIILLSLATGAFAQRPGTNRPSLNDIRRQINNETLRDLINADAENPKGPVNNSTNSRSAVFKQVQEDFKALQVVNNKMMAGAWAREEIDYGRVAEQISEINSRATRLKTCLSLPQAELKKRELSVSVSGAKDLRSALLVMDRSITSFVTSPVFQSASVIDIDSAARAAQDLEQVILLSSNLKKATASLKHSAAPK